MSAIISNPMIQYVVDSNNLTLLLLFIFILSATHIIGEEFVAGHCPVA